MAKIKKAQLGDYVRKSFKTADSLRNANPKYGSKGLKGMVDERKSNMAKADSIEKAVEKRVGVPRKYNLYEKKNGGPVKKAKSGASLKPVPADKEKSLGKLPTPVRNKMGYQKNGGKMKKARGGATLSPSGSNVSKRLSSYPKTIGKAMNGTTTPMQRRARVAAAIGRGAASRRKSRTTAQMPTMKMGGKCRGGCY